MRLPWKNWEQWLGVHDQLTLPSPLKLIPKSDRLSKLIPQLRVFCHSPVAAPPRYVQLTLELLELASRFPRDCEKLENSNAIRSELALTIIRAVNHITDFHRRGKPNQSVQDVATSIALPLFLVDIRHEATHK